MILLIVLLFLILTSLLKTKEVVDEKIDKWEEEIIVPNNNLNPLEVEEDKLDFVLEIPRKVENLLSKLFGFLFGLFEKIIS